MLSCLPAARHIEKVREVTPLSPEVIVAHTLNFTPIFKLSLLKMVEDPRHHTAVGCALAILGHSLARVKI